MITFRFLISLTVHTKIRYAANECCDCIYDEDPPTQRSQRIVQAHELESEARRLARDLEHKDYEAADEDHKAQEVAKPARSAMQDDSHMHMVYKLRHVSHVGIRGFPSLENSLLIT